MELRPSIVQEAAATRIPELPPVAETEVRVHRRSLPRRLLRWFLLLFVLLIVVDGVGSLLVRRERVRKRLDARLEAAFGRPVEVDSYSFSLWGGPTLEADGVRVAEDPRFGYEYFLRADSLAIRLRWSSLLRGRFGLGTILLENPTLNVVNNAAGDWNLADWLGHSAPTAPNTIGPTRSPFVPHFSEIEVDGGRIDFKRGDEKLPFAFVGVDGAIYAEGDQRWRLDLEASPWRAAELLQEPGTIHVSGKVGGTSSALRPATLQISWTAASASDFLRLMTGDDDGIRGSLGIAFNAHTDGEGWAIQGQAQLGELHRWDLTLLPDAPLLDVPSLNVTANMFLDLPASTLDIKDALLQAPRSNLQGVGRISWSGSASKPKAQANPVSFQIASADINLSDVLAWLRAFRQNVPPTVRVAGFARAHGAVSGWPLQFTDFAAQTYGAELSGDGLIAPLRLGRANLEYSAGSFHMPPATIKIAGAKGQEGSFRVEFDAPRSTRPAKKNQLAELQLSGTSQDAAEAIAAANAFGWNVARGWQLTGPLQCDLSWPRMEWPLKDPVGSVVIGAQGDEGASLRAPFLNLPVSGLQFRMDFKPGARHVTLTAAQAFGAHWSGAFERTDAAPQWQFALSADRLSTADLDRWLNPRWRESFIDRMLPFLSLGPATAVPDDLRGAGQLTIAEFKATPLVFQDLAGDLEINGRNVTFEHASAQLAGGKLIGSLDARLAATPTYNVRADFSKIDLGSFVGDTPADRAAAKSASTFGGVASGETQFSVSGTSRAAFANSLQCKGTIDIRNPAWRGVALLDSLQAGKFVAGDSVFSGAASQFACASGAISLKNIVLTTGQGEIDGAGTIDFAQHLDLQLRISPEESSKSSTKRSSDAPQANVSGTLAAPEFSRAIAGRRAR
jgi:uncharacterized protein involved in outer membrane biogenesis